MQECLRLIQEWNKDVACQDAQGMPSRVGMHSAAIEGGNLECVEYLLKVSLCPNMANHDRCRSVFVSD